MYRALTTQKTFKFPVDTEGQLVTQDFRLPDNVGTVTGYAISANRRDLAWARASVGLQMVGEEMIADGEDAAEYIFGLNHPSRTFAFGEMPVTNSNRACRFRVQDTSVPGYAFAPYVVKLIVRYRKQ